MKKVLLHIPILALMISALLTLTACNGTEGGTPGKPHNHNFVNGICETCGEKNYSEGLKYTLNSDEQSYTVSGIGTCTDKDIVIPSIYESKPVTSIGGWAFTDCTGLTSIAIPGSVTSIGSSAFSGCTGLTSITILDSVTSIGSSAFEDCTGLTSITLSGSVTSIGQSAFSKCIGLASITFKGTKAQWDAISKDSGWNSYTGTYTIHCTDGDISK